MHRRSTVMSCTQPIHNLSKSKKAKTLTLQCDCSWDSYNLFPIAKGSLTEKKKIRSVLFSINKT